MGSVSKKYAQSHKSIKFFFFFCSRIWRIIILGECFTVPNRHHLSSVCKCSARFGAQQKDWIEKNDERNIIVHYDSQFGIHHTRETGLNAEHCTFAHAMCNFMHEIPMFRYFFFFFFIIFWNVWYYKGETTSFQLN